MSEAALDMGAETVPLIAAWEQRLGNLLAAKTDGFSLIRLDASVGPGVAVNGHLGRASATFWTPETVFRTLAPSSLAVDDLAALPPQLLTALAESALEATIDEFADALGLSFVVALARIGPMEDLISVGRPQDHDAPGPLLQLPIETLDALLSALEARPPIDRPERDASTFIRLAAEAGRMDLPASELAALAAGDVLLPDGLLTDECDLATFDGTTVFGRASLDGSSAEMTNLWRSGVTADEWDDNLDDVEDPDEPGDEGELEDEAIDAQELVGAEGGEPETVFDVDGLEVTLRFVLGSTELSVADLRAVAVGSVIDLGEAPGETVKVFAGKRCIGHGEIVRIDDRIGVRITRIDGGRRG